MSDILFSTDDYVFSYRVTGICIQDGKVLLQKPTNDDGFAFPGGHVALGETNEETLIRELQLEGRNFEIEFHWIPLDKISEIEIYPANVVSLLASLSDGVQHSIYREQFFYNSTIFIQRFYFLKKKKTLLPT